MPRLLVSEDNGKQWHCCSPVFLSLTRFPPASRFLTEGMSPETRRTGSSVWHRSDKISSGFLDSCFYSTLTDIERRRWWRGKLWRLHDHKPWESVRGAVSHDRKHFFNPPPQKKTFINQHPIVISHALPGTVSEIKVNGLSVGLWSCWFFFPVWVKIVGLC